MSKRYSWKENNHSACYAWTTSQEPFQRVHGCGLCLTELAAAVRGTGFLGTKAGMAIGRRLGLEHDELVLSGAPPLDWNPSDEVLEHFEKLQEKARAVVGE